MLERGEGFEIQLANFIRQIVETAMTQPVVVNEQMLERLNGLHTEIFREGNERQLIRQSVRWKMKETTRLKQFGNDINKGKDTDHKRNSRATTTRSFEFYQKKPIPCLATTLWQAWHYLEKKIFKM